MVPACCGSLPSRPGRKRCTRSGPGVGHTATPQFLGNPLSTGGVGPLRAEAQIGVNFREGLSVFGHLQVGVGKLDVNLRRHIGME